MYDLHGHRGPMAFRCAARLNRINLSLFADPWRVVPTGLAESIKLLKKQHNKHHSYS